jgi:hypothetical protein
MSLRGVIRGRTIELETNPHPPDGMQVEVELRTPTPDPLWGLLADQPEQIESLCRIVHERTQQLWRPRTEL